MNERRRFWTKLAASDGIKKLASVAQAGDWKRREIQHAADALGLDDQVAAERELLLGILADIVFRLPSALTAPSRRKRGPDPAALDDAIINDATRVLKLGKRPKTLEDMAREIAALPGAKYGRRSSQPTLARRLGNIVRHRNKEGEPS
jgi:hypothetical protein